MTPASIMGCAPPHFLGRLKEKLDRARQLRAHTGKHLGYTHQHGRVQVVSAGMHDARLHAVVYRAHGTLVRHVHQLGHRQRVHVGAHGNGGPGLAALEHGHHTRNAAHVLLHVEAEALEMRGNQGGGALLLVAELRVLVDVMAPGGELGRDGGGAAVDLGGERRLGRGGGRAQ
jgi:hypothetical protein